MRGIYRVRRALCSSLYIALLSLIPMPSEAQFCTGDCVTHGHFNYEPTAFPFTEDITSSTSTPYSSPITIYGPTFDWTTIQSGCDLLNQQNLQATGAFNVLLRASVSIDTVTAAPGSRYEVQLLVDGVEHGWYLRRLRCQLPQYDRFEGTAQNIPAGNHVYSLQARLLDGGTVTFGQQWLTAQGAPIAYPGAKDVSVTEITINPGPTWTAITNTVSITTGSIVDVMLQGYVSINAGVPGDQLTFAFSLDDTLLPRTSSVAVPAYVADGVNIMDHLLNLAPGTHTLKLLARTLSGSATLQWRQVEFLTLPGHVYPGYAAVAEAAATNPITVSTDSADQPQPTVPLLHYICGRWTRLLEVNPPTVFGLNAGVISGYVQLLGNLQGSGLAQIVIQLNPPDGFDLGLSGLQVTPTADGLYFFGEANGGCAGCTITLWMRKLNGVCGSGDAGQFDVGNRYMVIKYVPNDGCLY